MQSLNLRPLPFLFVLIVTMVSCQKEAVPTESKLDLLTGRKWQLTNLYHQEVGDNIVSDFTEIHYNDCELDDSYHFAKDYSFFRRDSSNVCLVSPHFGLFGGAKWSVDSDFYEISFDSFPVYAYRMEIKTLTKSTLELSHRVIDYFQKEIIFTYRFRSIP
jgi:hypothetical protein